MKPKKILLAGSNGDEQSRQMGSFFRDAGFQVEISDNGRSALEEIMRHQFDLVISEVDLPQINGIDLLKRVKEFNSSLPIILIASDARVKEAVAVMKMGATDFLLKPLSEKMIRTIIAHTSNGLTQKDPAGRNGKYTIITQNREMKRLMQMAKKVADSRASVFIHGESGTGKELFARHLHKHSSRCDKLFVAINCAALPETLLESELFGHEKGAFTGAVTCKKGKFELAHQGTLLLDEISEMDYRLQSKLLRVLQEREIDRIGGAKPIPVDVRFVATTNRDIEKQIKAGKFREDLYYRLNVIPLHLPPLRNRNDDIPLLADYFIEKYTKMDNSPVKGITDEMLTALMQMPWQGNVREFENWIERAVLMCSGEIIDQKDLLMTQNRQPAPVSTGDPLMPAVSLKEMEQKVVLRALDQTQGNRTHAAEILGISVRTLRNKLNEYRNNMRPVENGI